jgi:hypothetical protein
VIFLLVFHQEKAVAQGADESFRRAFVFCFTFEKLGMVVNMGTNA